jgi:cellulose synthase/poly-beta-1,6-N-acetylglucosamine synthase-like glycosyltransferase
MKDFVAVLYITLIITAVIQVGIYWLKFRKLAFFNPTVLEGDKKPVSVIICARNEYDRLKKNLAAVLEQNYLSFEVIVVNDCSWDESATLLDEFSKRYSNLKIVTIKEQEKYTHGKKFALTLGIKAASNDVLILTDADCFPASKNWLSLLQRNFSSGVNIVLGYSPYEKEKGILNKLIRFDTFYTALQYLSSAINGRAYMGVGRNLAYKKSLFFSSKGFAKHNHILSGDDDLFVNENADKGNTAIEINPESFVQTEPKKSFSHWYKQKKRHLSTSTYYRFSDKLILAIQNGSLLVFYIALIGLIILKFDLRILLSLYGATLLLKYPIILKASTKLKEKDLAWTFPLLEFTHTILQPIFFTANLLTKQKTWK